MNKPVFIVEGPTEKAFVDDCLKPHWFETYGLYDVQARTLGVAGHKGGNVSAERIRKDATILLKQRSDAIVTTLVDYYGIKTDLPNHNQCEQLPTADLRIACLEAGLSTSIGSERFVPYLQKHEFESLLFSAGSRLTRYLAQQSCEAIEQLNHDFGGAENINSLNPPSYRLTEIVNQFDKFKYRKVAYGSILVLEIGIPAILKQCPRFAAWVVQIGQLAIP